MNITKKLLCLPLSKSVWPEGRIGPWQLQDGYRIIEEAVKLANNENSDGTLLLTATKPKDSPKSELDYMLEVTAVEDLKLGHLYVVSRCFDTPSQIDYAIKLANLSGYGKLLILCSPLHYLRVKWIISRIPIDTDLEISCKMVFGIPRPKEVITDLILTFMYPIIDTLGCDTWFRSYTEKRRSRGSL
jgi:hypothetical protein